MSRIGLKPIPLVKGVKIDVKNREVSVEGPKGKLKQSLPGGITVSMDDKEVSVKRRNETKEQKALHGLIRALLANAVTGVSTGFTKGLEIHGVGYTAAVQGKAVNFKLGHSHPIVFPIPSGIEIKVERNAVSVSGCDRQQVGQIAADIRASSRHWRR